MQLTSKNAFRSTLIFSALLFASAGVSQAAFTEFTEDFNDLDDWVASAVLGETPSVSGGVLTLDNKVTDVNARSIIRNPEADYNPFEQAFSVTLSGMTFTTDSGEDGRNVAYLAIGRMQTSDSGGISGTTNYYPNSSPVDGFSLLNVQIWDIGNQGLSISVGQKGAGSGNSLDRTEISAIPTSLTFSMTPNESTSLLDWQLDITGATFTSSGLSTITGSFDANVTMASMQNAYIALGNYNNYRAPDSAGVLTLDTLSVVAIPEVNQFSMLLGAAMLGGSLSARCCRAR